MLWFIFQSNIVMTCSIDERPLVIGEETGKLRDKAMEFARRCTGRCTGCTWHTYCIICSCSSFAFSPAVVLK